MKRSQSTYKFRNQRMNSLLAAAAAAGCVLAHTHAANADTFTWNQPAGGGWSSPANWAEGVAPVSANTTQLVFTPGSYTASDDLGDVTLNSVTINNPATDTTDNINI